MTTLNEAAKVYYEQSLAGTRIPDSDWFTAVGFNQVPNYRRVAALGNNSGIDIGTPEDVWSSGGIYPFLSAASALEIISSSVNDTAAGTGARTVLINGLDGSYVEISETVTLNGTTPVALTKTYLRINNAFIMSAGSLEVNAGNIDIRSPASTVRAQIPTGYGITRSSLYTVPAGHTLSELSLFCCINRSGGGAVRYATIATLFRNTNGFYRMPLEVSMSSNTPYRHDGNPGIIVAEKTDFLVRCNNVTVNATDITAAWLGVLKKN